MIGEEVPPVEVFAFMSARVSTRGVEGEVLLQLDTA
jgi:hypothetical protein